MSLVLAIATAMVLILWGVLRKKQPAGVPKPVFVRRFIHPGHTWMKETEDGDVLVGMDEFAVNLIGTIDDVTLPRLLKKVKQGEPAWYVRHNNRIVPLVSPVTGRVIEKNEMVRHNPQIVNTSPYTDGWLLRIRPRKMQAQLNNLFAGRAAHQWLEQARARLVALFSEESILMYQDGGELLRDFADRLSDEEWKQVAREFLLTDSETIDASTMKKGVPQW
ncbi:MAG TPA: glycine cleavage system protein H [Bacteroidota bacterium]|nr:glycine cleavage system protein H [Bacteroidota bacterium]